MAIDNLNYYSAGLPAGQLTDKYSSQPGCLRSKNLDIFSSSKSVKATAWSQPSATGAGVIKQDGDLILKTDGKVYDISTGTEVLVVDPSVNFPAYKVSYNGRNGTYEAAQWGTVKDMVVKYEGDERKSFVVYTDRASYTYSKVPYIAEKEFSTSSNLTYDTSSPFTNGYRFEKSSTSGSSSSIEINMPGVNMATVPIKVYASQYNSSDTDISLDSITWYKSKYYYDPQDDMMVGELDEITTLPVPAGDITQAPLLIEIPAAPDIYNNEIKLNFKYTKKDGASTFGWDGVLYVDMNLPSEAHRLPGYTNGDYNEYYSYLPIDDNRHLVDIGEYYWMPSLSSQTLYKWEDTRTEIANRQKVERYDFTAYMGWANDVSMDVISMVVWNEQVYMIGNMEGNGYITPCDLSGGRGTPYIAYGCEFNGVENIDYLMYLVGEDRGISTLWVYNGQELVPVIGGNKDNTANDIIGVDEQYKFDGKIINYRKNLILTTKDNRIFEYGQTFGGKGGAFIHEINGEITGLRVKGNDLIVKFEREVSGDTVEYETIYQDDTPIKRYNSEWLAVYPIILGNHLLEKEESDLYTSFILPSANTSLEFWGMANHYHFWTFTSSEDYTFSTESSYYMEGAVGDYELKFIERNENQYTFKLEGDLPVQTTNDMQIIDGEGNVLINYSDFNHFRKIGEITTDKYWEGEFRFHNLNNKLDLPRSHSLQVMVKGKGNQNYTPELFALDLVANQRERG